MHCLYICVSIDTKIICFPLLWFHTRTTLKLSFCKFCGRFTDLVCYYRLLDWPIFWMIWLDCPYWLWRRVLLVYPVYLISTKGARWVWPVRRRCLLLLGIWSYLRNCRGSVLLHIWIMITFDALLTSLSYILQEATKHSSLMFVTVQVYK
jgi:hypothetical protein